MKNQRRLIYYCNHKGLKVGQASLKLTETQPNCFSQHRALIDLLRTWWIKLIGLKGDQQTQRQTKLYPGKFWHHLKWTSESSTH